jgi:hypothetical protein
VFGTACALIGKPASVAGFDVAKWGLVALCVALLVDVTNRQVIARAEVPIDEDLDLSVRSNAIGVITGGGAAVAMLCIVHQWQLLALASFNQRTAAIEGLGLVWTVSEVSIDSGEPGPIVFAGQVADAGASVADLMVALIFIGNDRQIYWATKVPVTTS